jgi:hypothetical protein
MSSTSLLLRTMPIQGDDPSNRIAQPRATFRDEQVLGLWFFILLVLGCVLVRSAGSQMSDTFIIPLAKV